MTEKRLTPDFEPQDLAALDQWENEGGRSGLLLSPADEDVVQTDEDVEGVRRGNFGV